MHIIRYKMCVSSLTLNFCLIFKHVSRQKKKKKEKLTDLSSEEKNQNEVILVKTEKANPAS